MSCADERIVQLTLAGRYFSLIPCAPFLQHSCTSNSCGKTATHRLLSRATASIEWLCDAHAVAWAQDHGCMPDANSASKE